MTDVTKSAYRTSGKIFQEVSRLYNPGLLDQLKAISPTDLVVVTGTYDHIEKLLDTLKLPYTQIDSEDIASHNGGRVMFINCKSYDAGVPVKAVQEFVRSGGRLVTTDWALGVVTKSFPNKLNKTKDTTNDVVEIQCPTDLARRFIGLNYAQCHPQWWLECASHIYNIGEGVTPIITSQEMKDKYGQPYVTVGFTDGKGEVFHFISHLELQRTRLKTKEDKGSLEDFLAKMRISRTADMDDVKVAELEAAYSTLNTLAYLSLPAPILGATMKSTLIGSSGIGSSGKVSDSVGKSVRLA